MANTQMSPRALLKTRLRNLGGSVGMGVAELAQSALVHIEALEQERDNDRTVYRKAKALMAKAPPRDECPGCFSNLYDGARLMGWCTDCAPPELAGRARVGRDPRIGEWTTCLRDPSHIQELMRVGIQAATCSVCGSAMKYVPPAEESNKPIPQVDEEVRKLGCNCPIPTYLHDVGCPMYEPEPAPVEDIPAGAEKTSEIQTKLVRQLRAWPSVETCDKAIGDLMREAADEIERLQPAAGPWDASRTMGGAFHWKDGLYFYRMPDGAVRIVHDDIRGGSGLGPNMLAPEGTQSNHLDVIVPRAEWESIVGSVESAPKILVPASCPVSVTCEREGECSGMCPVRDRPAAHVQKMDMHADLIARLDECRKMIGQMCSEGRPPKMSIPCRPEVDEDIVICRALKEAMVTLGESSAPKMDMLQGLDTPERVRFYEHDFYVLSNFSAFNIDWQGHIFDTSEHVYHWEKFRGTPFLRDQILGAASAHDAFKIAESHRDERRDDWNAVKVGIMREILRAKAAQHEYVRRKLLATGERELVEDSWRDDFWGWGPKRDGKNMLGKLWMEIRAELRGAVSEEAIPR